MASKAKAKAIDALFAAGVTSSESDVAWIVSELKKRESKAAAVAAAADQVAQATAGKRVQLPPPPPLQGKKAADATKEVFKHTERLKYQDEDWKTRDEALARLQVLIREGALSCDGFTNGFAANLKDLVHSLVAQLYDLRSVIVKSAVKTLDLLMTEVGDHAAAEAPIREDVIEGLLQLASSGNKVLSASGRDAFPKFVETVRFESMLTEDKGFVYWLRGMKHVPVKVCCLNALLQALQTWPPQLFSSSYEALEVAFVEAAANPSGDVRALGRACLLQHLQNAPGRSEQVDKWMRSYPDTKKQLDKEQPRPGAIPLEDRVAPVLRQGESGAKQRNGKLSAGAGGPEGKAGKKPSLLKRMSSKKLSSAAEPAPPSGRGEDTSIVGQMLALKERKSEMSDEEYEAERQRILQSV